MSLPVKIDARSELGPCLGFLYPPGLAQGDLVVRARYLGQEVRLSRAEQAVLEDVIRARYGGMFA